MRKILLLALLSLLPLPMAAQFQVGQKTSISGPPPPPVYMLSGTPSASTRNDSTLSVGYRFVAATAVAPNGLCRWVISGNTQTHTVYFRDATASVTLASVSVNTAGAPVGYACTAISVGALTVGHTYEVASCEFLGGDLWYNYQTYTVDSTFASDIGAGYGSCGGALSGATTGGTSYVPVNMTR